MKILSTIRNVPGGLMLVPLLLAAIINTFCPSLLTIGDPLGSLVTRQGTMAMMIMFVVYSGIQFDGEAVISCLKRGGKLIVFKYVLAVVVSFSCMSIFGLDGVFGIPTLAIVTAMMMTNPGLYLALMEDCGDEADKASFTILAVLALPYVPMCVFGYADGAGLDYNSILATMLPFLFGLVLGKLDPAIKEFTKHGMPLLLPFYGFAMGTSVDLIDACQMFMGGVVLYLIYFVFSVVPTILFDQYFLKQKGHAAAAVCSFGGIAVIVPSIVAETYPAYAPYAETAVSQLALAMLIGIVVSPLLTKVLAARKEDGNIVDVNKVLHVNTHMDVQVGAPQEELQLDE